MEKKQADIDDLLATFSSHIKENCPEPGRFRENLFALLLAKKQRMNEKSYIDSLERNIVFLQELNMEGEVFLEEILECINDEVSVLDDGAGPVLDGMEKRVREIAPARHREIFVEGHKGSLEGLALLKKGDRKEYVEKLEFNYSYLMTLRMLLFEFFNVIVEIRKGYVIDRVDSAAPSHIMNHVEVTANYYLGNVSVGEVVEEKQDSGST